MIQLDCQIHCKYHPMALLVDDYAAGDVICTECGLVVGDRVIDVGAEWRSFENDSTEGREPSRVGGPENKLFSDGGLSTIMGPPTNGRNKGSYGEHHYVNRNVPSSDRALKVAFGEIANMAARINLPRSIVDRANYLFKEIQVISNIRSRSAEAKATACLYIACRQEGVPRTFKEICAISRTNKRDIGRCFKTIIKALNTDLDLIKSGDFMARFCATLGLPISVEREATYIAKTAMDMNIVNGKSPISVAAASIFMASQISGSSRCYKTISDIAGVTECTIRGTYKDLRSYAKQLLPKDSKFLTSIHLLPE